MIKQSDKWARLLNELCSQGGLDVYRDTLAQILQRIRNSSCKVSIRYDVEYSNIQDSIENGQHIRVSLKNVKDPLSIIWKLLHEFGHCLSGPRTKEDTTMRREELAWKHADELLTYYPDLMLKIDEYTKCKTECLESYRRNLNKQ